MPRNRKSTNYDRQQFQSAITDCLSKAIVEVAEEEFQRLSSRVSPTERIEAIYDAVNELDELRKGHISRYQNEWSPLLHLTWYQPRQINLAYTLAHSRMAKIRWTATSSKVKNLYVLDYGCGALAMQFGLAISQLHRMIKTQTPQYPSQIRVHSIDKNMPMIDIGRKTWNRFIRPFSELVNELIDRENLIPDLKPLQSKIIENITEADPEDSDERWICALQLTDSQNQHTLKKDLYELERLIEPTAGFISSAFWETSRLILDTSPFNQDNRYRIYLSGEYEPNFRDDIKQVTLWRKNIHQHLLRDLNSADRQTTQESTEKRPDSEERRNSLSSLSKNVSWTGADTPFCLITYAQDQSRPITLTDAVRMGLSANDMAADLTNLGSAKITHQEAGQVLTKPTGFIGDYDFTLNSYIGCWFGCTYCYAAFFSPTKERTNTWGEWVKVKHNAAALLEKQKPGSLDGKLIYMSSVTDPYHPVERKLKLTRRLLEIVAERHKPKLVVQTRSPDVVRDIDLYQQIEQNGGEVRINMTVTTDDEDVRRTFEPYCPSNASRMNAVAEVQSQGIESGITMTPLIWVNDVHSFVDKLLGTGVKHFIAQPFHFQSKGSQFVASTGEEAFRLIAENLDCDPNDIRDSDDLTNPYMKHYREVFSVLKDRLPEIGEGKEGFKPPFFEPAITDCLSEAIVNVAEEEFQRLSQGLTPLELAEAIYDAFDELGKLSISQMPNYKNEWVPLLYLVWYHPSQTNLAYSMIMQHGWEPEIQNRSLYVADYGCGTLAMLFGLAIAKLESMKNELPYPDQISIDLIDESNPMVEIGMKTWTRFIELIQKDLRLPDLNPLDVKVIDKSDRVEPRYGDERWISALHTVYHENRAAVEDDLIQLEKSISPAAGFITAFSRKEQLARDTSPFTTGMGDYSLVFKGTPERKFSRNLDNITKWIENIHNHLAKHDDLEELIERPLTSYESIGKQHSIASLTKKGDVTWVRGGEPFALIYKQQTPRKEGLEDLPW